MDGREPRVQPPTLESYSDMPLFNTKAVVHNTGVPAPTLRAWERRYGILAPRRGENDYRLYSERDMIMVSWLRERVESGMTISQAIALLRSLEPLRKGKGRRSRAHIAISQDVSGQPIAVAPSRFSAEELSTTLIQQFAALDEPSASRTISQALAIYSVEDVCLSLFTPTLVEIGQRWASGELGVTVEHFASAVIRAQLDSLFRSAAGAESGPLVLVGCAPGEMHELGSLMLALFLRRMGVRVAYLGQNVEIASLLTTIRALKPACLVLSAATRPHIDALAEVGRVLEREVGPRTLFFFGGQAFAGESELTQSIPGRYLPGDAHQATDELKKKMTT